VKISGGKLKGRNIGSALKSKLGKECQSLRPTTSKVRESIFNILRESVIDSVFLDLYAGTGAVGMEALSRGAKTVFFVESDFDRADKIQNALNDMSMAAKANVIKKKAYDFVNAAEKSCMKFDILFLDPPYYSDELENMLYLISEKGLVNDNGILVAEHSSKKKLPLEIGNLVQKKDYKYGDTMLTLFRKAI
jgi:16S rRNA (guanine966-N2)-methyltransferase